MTGTSALLWLLATGTAFAQGPRTFTDPRDAEVYGLAEVAGLTWMTENLRHAAAGSVCFGWRDEHCRRLGRLYSWEAALQACPVGWHLATDYEWQKLELAVGVPFEELQGRAERGEPAGEKLKMTSDFPLRFPFAGYADPEGNFRRLDTATAVWTATEADYHHAWHRDLHADRTGIYRSRVYKPWLLSVRCVANRAASAAPVVPDSAAVTAPDAARDSMAIVTAARAFSAAYVRNDTTALGMIYADSAVLLPPNREIRGRAAIRRYFAWSGNYRQLAHAMQSERLTIRGDVAIEIGTWTSRSQRGAAEPTTASERYLAIWVRERDGAWRIWYDMWHRPTP